MILRLFLDTNVVLDLFQNSRPFHKSSLGLFKSASSGEVELTIAAVTILNVIYVLRKADEPSEIAQKMKGLLRFLKVAQTDHATLVSAMDSGWHDLEDAVQYQTALSIGKIDFIVTGDHNFMRQAMSISVIDPDHAFATLR